MGRVKRQRLGRGVYHVLNRALDQRWILDDDDAKALLVEQLQRFLPAGEIQVYHWAVMSNHFHLALEVVSPAALSRYVGQVCRNFTLWHHRQHGGCGPLWQGRFKSIVVQKDGYLGRLARYIERNPVRAGVEGVECPWDYPWSSARPYVDPVATDPLTAGFSGHPTFQPGSDPARWRQWYRQLLLNAQEAADDEGLFRRSPPVVGDNDFARHVHTRQGRPTARGAGRPRRRRGNK